jgi:hypothetical protein
VARGVEAGAGRRAAVGGGRERGVRGRSAREEVAAQIRREEEAGDFKISAA